MHLNKLSLGLDHPKDHQDTTGISLGSLSSQDQTGVDNMVPDGLGSLGDFPKFLDMQNMLHIDPAILSHDYSSEGSQPDQGILESRLMSRTELNLPTTHC